ncbi:CubicO group peptidase, beta-lactamase class C family [Pseudoxanthobacter soli DSM 19599]|uniref:CubicO group peptidase, beta-lactamase class C family n=2 Tax=Pseudoxanthobacter TaxID=433838 RepID=A0A1M7ZHV4_9HYPH|nr:CubicO group peptidase, beta-lactamase class C family [Pseudoxanthobacter soli DSM 19599]
MTGSPADQRDMSPAGAHDAGHRFPGGDAGLRARVDAVVDRAIDDRRIVGTVVLVAHHGRLVHARAAGFADREAGRAMTADTLFRLASVTKPFVTAATLALAERGVLGLDDPVTRFLPDFRPRLADGRAPVITLRHLLTHTAGLSYGFIEGADSPYRAAGVCDGMDQPGLSMAENLARIASVPLLFEPGSAWLYSVATDVLGAALEAATGEGLGALVERLVAAPLAISDTGFEVRDPARLAVAYADDPAGGAPVPMGAHHTVQGAAGTIFYAPSRAFDPTSFASGGAGMIGTAGDILAFLEALRTGGGAILTPGSAALFGTPAIGRDEIDPEKPGWTFGVGAAVLIDPAPTATPQPAGTFAWGGAYGHSWFVDPVNGVTVVALTNTAIAGMAGAFPDGIRDAVYG